MVTSQQRGYKFSDQTVATTSVSRTIKDSPIRSVKCRISKKGEVKKLNSKTFSSFFLFFDRLAKLQD